MKWLYVFFSSRRRHTRYWRDWSSDVCSSDLEVHFRVSSPPVKGPCYYGIDMDSPDQLVGANLTVEEIRAQIGATTLAYLSTDAMIAATQQRKDRLCRACFDGD